MIKSAGAARSPHNGEADGKRTDISQEDLGLRSRALLQTGTTQNHHHVHLRHASLRLKSVSMQTVNALHYITLSRF